MNEEINQIDENTIEITKTETITNKLVISRGSLEKEIEIILADLEVLDNNKNELLATLAEKQGRLSLFDNQ